MKMKFVKILSVFAALVLSAVLFSFGASASETYGDLKYEVNDGKATVLATTSQSFSGVLTIPDTLGGCPVTEIAAAAFQYRYNMTGVVIPDTVTKIGDNAFYSCSKLTSISFPASVKEIGDDLIDMCGSLVTLEVDENNPVFRGAGNCLIEKATGKILLGCKGSVIPDDGTIKEIGEGAFEGNVVSNLVLPDGLVKIGDNAYVRISSSDIPSSLEEIGNNGLVVSGVTGCLTLPEGLKKVGRGFIFGDFSEVVIPASLTEIGEVAFGSSKKIKKITVAEGNTAYRVVDDCLIDIEKKCLLWGKEGSVIPTDGSVTRIGQGAFSGNNSIKSIVIPDTVTEIGQGAFAGTYLNEITLPRGLTEIEDEVFIGCGYLTSITIPENVTRIGDRAFRSCTNLENIEFPSGIEYVGHAVFNDPYGTLESYSAKWYKNQPDGPIYIGKAFYDYKGECPEKYEIEDGTVSISPAAFLDCKNLKELTIPPTVKEIGDEAFRNCGFESLTLPDGLKEIKEYTFDYCSALTSLTVPDSVEVIGNSAFNQSSIAEIKLPASLKTIEGYAFQDCRQLTLIIFPEGVESIGDRAFSYCRKLQIVLSDNITSIGKDVLSYGSASFYAKPGTVTENTLKEAGYGYDLTDGTFKYYELIFQEGVYSLAGPFDKTLTSAVIPSEFNGGKVTEIGSAAFQDCKELTSVEIPDSVTALEYGCFSGCTALTSVEIPDSVTALGNGCFSGCTALTSVKFPDPLERIGGSAFYGCTSLAEIEIPDSVTEIGYAALHNTAWFDAQPDGVVYAGKVAYTVKGDCPEEITVKKGTVAVADDAFEFRDELKSVVLPSSVKKIGEAAFCDCTNLTYIAIPSSVRFIGYDAFGWYNKTVVIHGSAGSYAQKYAKDNKLKFVADLPDETVYGDADGDGVVGAADVVRLKKVMMEFDLSTGEIDYVPELDANGDGKITALDIIRVKKYLAYFDPATGKSPIKLGPAV